MPKDLAMPIETSDSAIGRNVRSRSCRSDPAAPRRVPAAAKRRGCRRGESQPTPVKDRHLRYICRTDGGNSSVRFSRMNVVE